MSFIPYLGLIRELEKLEEAGEDGPDQAVCREPRYYAGPAVSNPEVEKIPCYNSSLS